jgi:tRNA pseudouridine13 synthase
MSEPDRAQAHDPGYTTGDLPGAGGRVGPAPEDFVVDEVPALEPQGEGEHWWVRIRKRLWTTPDAVRCVGLAAGVDQRDIGFAGMKDKHAVTTQWLSVPARAAAPSDWRLPDGIEVVLAIRHRQKLRTGQLRGNHFRLRLVELRAEGYARAQAIAVRLTERGLLNYFGAQRFGRGQNNLAIAWDWLERGAPSAGRQTRFYRKFYPSVVQAEIFNRYLTLRRAVGIDRVLAGDVMRLGHSKAVFLVEHPEQEQGRLEAREILLTGPIWGPKMKPATGEPRALEIRALGDLGRSERLERTLGQLVDGTRRDLLVWPENLEIERLDDFAVELRFGLPSGSYATQVVKEFTRIREGAPRETGPDGRIAEESPEV